MAMPPPRWRELVRSAASGSGEAQNRPQWRGGGQAERVKRRTEDPFFPDRSGLQVRLRLRITHGKSPNREGCSVDHSPRVVFPWGACRDGASILEMASNAATALAAKTKASKA